MLRKLSGYLCTIFTIFSLSLPVYAADDYTVMDYTGKTVSVEDSNISLIIENIKKTDGDDAANAYIEAMASGDYTQFYKIVDNDTETAMISKYMDLSEPTKPNIPLTKPQEMESWVQTFLGPEGSVSELGKILKERGYTQDNDGATDYFVAIVTNTDTRPDSAKNPVYRLSEIGLNLRSMQDLELYEQGKIVEYEDEPLSIKQKQIIEKYGLTIVNAADVYDRQTLAENEQGMQQAVTDNSVDTMNTQIPEDKPVTQPVQWTPKTFLSVLSIGVIVTIIGTVVFYKALSGRKESKYDKKKPHK